MGKRGLAAPAQIILIIVVAIVAAAIVALFINESISRSGSTIDAQRIVLDSGFSITSIRADGTDWKVGVRKERGDGAYPTVVLYDPDGDSLSKSYDDPLSIYQTVVVQVPVSELEAANIDVVYKAEVYASALDKRGEVVSSRNPKDVRLPSVEQLAPPEDFCGNGAIDSGEDCDDGDLDSGDGCSASCHVESGWYCASEPSVCGTQCDDGVTAGAEVCDDGSLNGCEGYPGCDATCSDILECGNGDEECEEECDDGDANNHDSCIIDLGEDYSCVDAFCGDAYVWDDDCGSECEECDDGNSLEDDECDNYCAYTVCGDNIIQSPNGEGVGGILGDGYEECDTNKLAGQSCGSRGYASGILSCSASCTFDESGCVPVVSCGNGIVDQSEECDDGGTMGGDGCSGACQIELGWDCSGEPSVCTTECGDGVVISGGEECDDGGRVRGDGCDANCMIEPYWECSGQPSDCQAICGDGVVVLGEEECDDEKDGIYTDQCYDDCTFTYCGDGIVQRPNGDESGYLGGMEECDRGAGNSDTQPGGCRTNCRIHYCGDGVCDPGEISFTLGGCYQDCGEGPPNQEDEELPEGIEITEEFDFFYDNRPGGIDSSETFDDDFDSGAGQDGITETR